MTISLENAKKLYEVAEKNGFSLPENITFEDLLEWLMDREEGARFVFIKTDDGYIVSHEKYDASIDGEGEDFESALCNLAIKLIPVIW